MQEASKRLAEEAERRKDFYKDYDDVKVEFINGEVIVHSPAKVKHLECVNNIAELMSIYAKINKNGTICKEKAMISLVRNDYMPDIVYFNNQQSATITKDQWQFDAPSLIVEVLSDSTRSTDRGIKWRDYAKAGVMEYWIVDADEETVEQFILTDDNSFDLHIKAQTGMIRSSAIHGFEIPIRACFDAVENLKEHVRIVEKYK